MLGQIFEKFVHHFLFPFFSSFKALFFLTHDSAHCFLFIYECNTPVIFFVDHKIWECACFKLAQDKDAGARDWAGATLRLSPGSLPDPEAVAEGRATGGWLSASGPGPNLTAFGPGPESESAVHGYSARIKSVRVHGYSAGARRQAQGSPPLQPPPAGGVALFSRRGCRAGQNPAGVTAGIDVPAPACEAPQASVQRGRLRGRPGRPAQRGRTGGPGRSADTRRDAGRDPSGLAESNPGGGRESRLRDPARLGRPGTRCPT